MSHELPKQGLRVGFETLGCRSNYADTIELQTALSAEGAVPTSFDAPADIYVINTCTVTDDADRTAMRLIRSARARSPHAKIVVTGCMAETSPEKIEALGIADAIVGPGKKRAVLEAILSTETDNKPAKAAPLLAKRARPGRPARRADPLDEPLSEKLPGPGTYLGEVKTRARFHLRVQEGCENSCTFCIIPASRGALVSRPLNLILEDLSRLSDLGYEEVVLTGTHLGGWGEDIGSSLDDMLAELAARSPIRRLRLSSVDPNDISRKTIEILAESHIYCRHLHICVQAFSDPVLKRMNRRYRLSQIYEIVGAVSELIPGCCLGSDLIAGFPGESRQELEQAIQVFLGLPFSYLHVFPYSQRSGTAATRLDGAVETSERKRRTARWRALSESRRRDFHQALLGKHLELIVEKIDDGFVQATSREYAAAKVLFSERIPPWKPGERVLKIAHSYDERDGRLLCV
ncbi:MAG: MiaB/RimO family radical SAM methylthiotransferase [Bdellovibrionota bacterium]